MSPVPASCSTVVSNEVNAGYPGEPGGGGGIYNAGTVKSWNCLYAGNIDQTNIAPDFCGFLDSSGFGAQGFNLVQNPRGCTNYARRFYRLEAPDTSAALPEGVSELPKARQ